MKSLETIEHEQIEFFGPASATSYKIGVVANNWLVDLLVTQFSQEQL